jgi:hypothetical protein
MREAAGAGLLLPRDEQEPRRPTPEKEKTMRPQFIMPAHTPGPRDGRACHRPPSRLRTKVLLTGAVPVLVLLAAGCSSGTQSSTAAAVSSVAASATPGGATVSTAASAPAGTTAPAAASDLTGTWNGTYNGSYSGTFTVKWTQSGSSVNGTIALPTVGTTEQLNGTVSGDKITFGTVGSFAVTYSGTFSGNSMSGTYNVTGSPAGNWSATRA